MTQHHRGSRITGAGAWALAISGVLPWFTAGAMSQRVLGGRSWVALIAGLVALWWHYRPPRSVRVEPAVVFAGASCAGLVTGVSALIVQPAALGPSVGIVVCLVGSILLGTSAVMSLRRGAAEADETNDDTAGVDLVGDVAAVDDPIDAEQAQPIAPTTPSRARRVAKAGAWVVLVAVGVVVIWPASIGDLSAQAEPTDTYADAVALFDTTTADEPGRIYEPCESQLMTHGDRVDVAVVLFHGLTNCPKQFVELGTQLHEQGANVLILRAPGHGVANDAGDAIGGLSNVAGLTAEQLRTYADTAIDIGGGLGDDVRVLGLSMGGVVSTWVAQERADVQRVVAVAPAMTIPTVPAFLTNALRNVASKLPNIDLPGQSKLDHAYAGETTKGLAATFIMGKYVADEAYERGPAAQDVVVVLNPDDDQVDPTHLAAFAERWADHGDAVSLHRLPAVGLPHDVIDPDQPDGDVGLVYPTLLSLLADGEAPGSG